MEQILNLKSFINEGKIFLSSGDVATEKKQENKKKTVNIPHISLVLENDTDFILKRETKTSVSLLVCILSQGLIYIKNEKTGEIKNCVYKDVINFLNGSDYHGYDNNLSFTNLKYEIFDKGFVTPHLSSFFEFALKNRELVKNLVNNKIFLSSFCFASKTLMTIIENIAPEVLSKWIIFAKENLRVEDLSKTEVEYIINFFTKLKQAGINFDKIKHNAEKMRAISAVNKEWWHFSTREDKGLVGAIQDFNLEFNRVCDYLLYLSTVEGLRVEMGGGYWSNKEFPSKDYYDYLDMQKKMYGSVKIKYPENWLTEHHKLIVTYNTWAKLHENDIILKQAKNLEPLLYENKEYIVIAPKSSNDVIDEGYQLGHCVGSYVSRIVAGETNILFVRYKSTPTESLVTVEVNDNAICQYRGKGNRSVTEEEKDFLKEWATARNLKFIER